VSWIELDQSADGLGWIGSHKTDPWTTLVDARGSRETGSERCGASLSVQQRLVVLQSGRWYVRQVNTWTLRNEDRYLAWDFQQDVHNAFDFYLSMKVDGIFTDFPQSLARHLDLVYRASGSV